MMILVGLGNPGDEYSQNRHNVGFMFADFIAALLLNKEEYPKGEVANFKSDKYVLSDVSKGEMKMKDKKEKIIIAKPQTFMNRSGDAVRKIIAASNDVSARLIVAHDDLDLRIGNFKIQKGVGPKMHNGITSIEETLGTNDFWRIRIGVDNRDDEQRIPGETYVLQDFFEEEQKLLPEIFSSIMNRFLPILHQL